jgi:hypothetical protein
VEVAAEWELPSWLVWCVHYQVMFTIDEHTQKVNTGGRMASEMTDAEASPDAGDWLSVIILP